MRDLREISLRTYALAFAVVLSPALFQTSSLCQTGNPNLAGLELEVDGVNQIAFVPGQASYTVTMSSPTAILRAQSEDPAATISYQWWDGPTLLGTWTLGTGDVEATLDVPEGLRTLRVHVKAPGGAGAGTDIEITNSTAVAYPCTEVGIRQAISDGGGPHYFDCQAMTTVTTAYPIRINNDVILDGEGNLTVDGNDDHTVVLVDDGITAEIRGMTLTGGATTGVGGGIKSGDGNLTVTDSIISGNTARLGGGGIRSSGDLTLRSSIVSGNNNTLSNGTGGGIAHGGGTLTIVDSTISDNLANSGGGIKASGDGTITNSTISGNIARNGAGISNYSGDLTIMNSTISGNTALAGGGGIYNTESSGGAASLILVNTTISGNTAFEFGSSLMNNGNLAVLVLLNSVIAGECFISYGAPIAQYTIESPGDTCLLPAGQWNLDNVTAAELNLGPLQDNGGVTFTQAPLVGSVLIDHIHEVACEDFAGAPITSDQRGVSRPENIGCDVGSVEGYCDDCNDDLDCTVDLCDPIIRTCSHSTAADGSPCESGNGTCAAGVCMGPVRQWGTAELLESSDVNAVEPRVAMESLGNITVAWRESDGVSGNVWSSRFQPVGSPGGGWDAPVVISNINTPDVLDPELAMDSNGNVVAVWAQHNGTTNFEIWSNHFTPDPPAGWSAAEAISGPGGFYPRVAMGSYGYGMVVWRQPDGSYDSVWANRFTLSEGGWGTAEPVETAEGHAGSMEVAMSGQGNAIAVWHQSDGTRNNIWASHYTWYPTPSSWSTPVLLETNDAGNASNPQIAMDVQGNAVAVWSQFDGVRQNIWSNRYAASAGWAGAELLETDDTDSASSPRVAMDGQGNAVVVWHQSDGTSFNIWSNRYAASAGWAGAELLEVNDGDASSAEVAMNAFGYAVAVWLQSDGTYVNVWSNRYAPSRGWGTAELLESSDGNASEARVSIDARGNAVAVWQQHDGMRNNIWSNQLR